MQYKLYFFTEVIDLSDASKVAQAIQAALDKFFPPNIVFVKDYKELDEKTFELTILRHYKDDAGASMSGFICDHDEALISGLDIVVFQPFDPNQKKLLRMIPWYDGMVYSPLIDFYEFWKKANEAMTGEKIKDIQIVPEETSLYIKVTFKQKRKKKKP